MLFVLFTLLPMMLDLGSLEGQNSAETQLAIKLHIVSDELNGRDHIYQIYFQT